MTPGLGGMLAERAERDSKHVADSPTAPPCTSASTDYSEGWSYSFNTTSQVEAQNWKLDSASGHSSEYLSQQDEQSISGGYRGTYTDDVPGSHTTTGSIQVDYSRSHSSSQTSLAYVDWRLGSGGMSYTSDTTLTGSASGTFDYSSHEEKYTTYADGHWLQFSSDFAQTRSGQGSTRSEVHGGTDGGTTASRARREHGTGSMGYGYSTRSDQASSLGVGQQSDYYNYSRNGDDGLFTIINHVHGSRSSWTPSNTDSGSYDHMKDYTGFYRYEGSEGPYNTPVAGYVLAVPSTGGLTENDLLTPPQLTIPGPGGTVVGHGGSYNVTLKGGDGNGLIVDMSEFFHFGVIKGVGSGVFSFGGFVT